MDKKELDKLIEQALNEKFTQDVRGLDWKALKKAISLSGKLGDYGVENGTEAIAKINQIAKLEKGQTELEAEDIEKVYVGKVKELIPFLDAIEKNTSNTELQTTIRNAKDEAAKLLAKDLGADFKRAKTAPEPYAFGQIGKVYTKGTVTDEPTGNWKDWNKIKNSLGEIDPILDDLFQSIDGKTTIEKWTNLQFFATEAMKGANGLNNWYKSKGGGNEFKLMNYSLILSLMADTPKLSDTSNAGNFFEGFLAYLLNAPVAGKAGRAIDNLTQLADGNKVYMSAKYYTSLGGVKQSEGNLQADTFEFGDIYYFTMVKRATQGKDISTGSKFDVLDLYLTRITGYGGTETKLKGKGLDGAKGFKKLKAQMIDSDGKPAGEPWQVKKGAIFTGAPDTNKPAFSLPVLNLPKNVDAKKIEDELSKFTANFLSKELQKSNQKRAKAVASVLKELSLMDQKIKGYSGAKGNPNDPAAQPGQKAQEAKDYMKALYTSHKAATEAYQNVFKYDATTKTGEQGEKFKDIKFNESKSALDQLIEAIIKEKLLK